MGIAVAARVPTAQGEQALPRLHRRGRLEPAVARRRSADLGACRLSRFGQRPDPTSGLRFLASRPATLPAGLGQAPERGLGRRHHFPPRTPAWLAGGDRLAFGPLLRRAASPQERAVYQQTQTGHRAVSRLCHPLHRAVWRALHVGVDVGPAWGKDQRGAAPPARAHSGTGRENPPRLAGSGVLLLARDRLVASRTAAVLDAGHVPWPQAEEAVCTDGPELAQAAKGRLVCAHAEPRRTDGVDFGLRELSLVPASQEQEAAQPETAVCRVACARYADRDSRALSPAFWHRVELPATAASAHRDLYAQAALAAGVHRSRPAAAQLVGVGSRHAAGRRSRREQNAASGAAAFQADARLDRSDGSRHTSRRLRALRQLE